MSEFDDAAAMIGVVHGYLYPDGKSCILRFSTPRGETNHISIPVAGVAVLSDIAVPGMRHLLIGKPQRPATGSSR